MPFISVQIMNGFGLTVKQKAAGLQSFLEGGADQNDVEALFREFPRNECANVCQKALLAGHLMFEHKCMSWRGKSPAMVGFGKEASTLQLCSTQFVSAQIAFSLLGAGLS